MPRHAFIDAGLHAQAYEDTALPIGQEQTISKPSVVARMIDAVFPPAGYQVGDALVFLLAVAAFEIGRAHV